MDGDGSTRRVPYERGSDGVEVSESCFHTAIAPMFLGVSKNLVYAFNAIHSHRHHNR